VIAALASQDERGRGRTARRVCRMFREHGDTMMEPCGHLALCGACNKNGNRNRGDATCVLCRTPGRALHLLSNELWDGTYDVSDAPCISLADGSVTLPTMEEELRSLVPASGRWDKGCSPKLDLRRKKREIAQRSRQTLSTKTQHTICTRGEVNLALWSQTSALAGGRHGKRAQAALEAQSWADYGRAVSRWKADIKWSRAQLRQLGPAVGHSEEAAPHHLFTALHGRNWGWNRRNGLRSMLHRQAKLPRPILGRSWLVNNLLQRQRPRSSPFQSRHGRGTDTRRFALQTVRAQAEKEADHRAYLRRQRKEVEEEAAAMAEATVAAAHEISLSSRECATCEAAEACMVHLACRHIALCRPCWEASPSCECPRCGEHSGVVLCVHRP